MFLPCFCRTYGYSRIKFGTTEARRMNWALSPVQTDKTLLTNKLPTLLDVACFVRLHTLLPVVRSCCAKIETGQTFSNVRTDTTSAYHLYGKPGNSGENSNGTVHPVEILRKKVIPFKVLPFFRFYPNDRNFLYHLSG